MSDVILNLLTGEEQVIPLSPQEIAARAAARALAEQADQVEQGRAANAGVIRAALVQAIADNVAILATVEQGQTLVDEVTAAATTLSTITIGNLGAAQTALRGVGTNMIKVTTVQEASIGAIATSLRQLTKLARLMLGELDGTD